MKSLVPCAIHIGALQSGTTENARDIIMYGREKILDSHFTVLSRQSSVTMTNQKQK